MAFGRPAKRPIVTLVFRIGVMAMSTRMIVLLAVLRRAMDIRAGRPISLRGSRHALSRRCRWRSSRSGCGAGSRGRRCGGVIAIASVRRNNRVPSVAAPEPPHHASNHRNAATAPARSRSPARSRRRAHGFGTGPVFLVVEIMMAALPAVVVAERLGLHQRRVIGVGRGGGGCGRSTPAAQQARMIARR